MNPDDIKRWLISLIAAFGKRVSDEQLRLYFDKLSQVQAEQNYSDYHWNHALSRMIADLDMFPSLSVVYGYLRTGGVRDLNDTDFPVLMFDMNGVRCVLGQRDKDGKLSPKRIDPTRALPVPLGATNEHLVIPPSQQAREGLRDYSQQITELTGIAAEIPF